MKGAWGIISVICLGLSFGVIPAFAQTENPIIFPTAFSESDRTGHVLDTFVFQFSRDDTSTGTWLIKSDNCRINSSNIKHSGLFTWQATSIDEGKTCAVIVRHTGNDQAARPFNLHIHDSHVQVRTDISEGQVPPSLSDFLPEDPDENSSDPVSKYTITTFSATNIQRNEQLDLFEEIVNSLDEETGDFSRSLACDAIRDGNEFAEFGFIWRFEDSDSAASVFSVMRIHNDENCNQMPTFDSEYDADIFVGDTIPSLADTVNNPDHPSDPISRYNITDRGTEPSLPDYIVESLDPNTGEFTTPFLCASIGSNVVREFSFDWTFADGTGTYTAPGMIRVTNGDACTFKNYGSDLLVGQIPPPLSDSTPNFEDSDPATSYSIDQGNLPDPLPDYIVESLDPNTGEFSAPFLCASFGADAQREFRFSWTFTDGTDESTQLGIMNVANTKECIVTTYASDLLEGDIPPPFSPLIPNFEGPNLVPTYNITDRGVPAPGLPQYIVDSLDPNTGEFSAPFRCDAFFTDPDSPSDTLTYLFLWTFENSNVDSSGNQFASMTLHENEDCNDIPTFTSYNSTVSEGQIPLSLSSAVINPDLVQGDPISIYRIKSGDLPQSFIDSLNANSEFADHGTFDSFSFDTVSTQQGSRDFEFVWTFEDGTGESGNQNGTLTVDNMNQAPTIDDPISNFPSFLRTNEPVSFRLSGTDLDDDALIWDISSPDFGASIDQDGIFSWTPLEQHVGMNEFTFTLTDSVLTAVPRSHTFDVRIPPTIVEYRETVSENGPIPSLSSVVTNPDANLADAPSIYRIKSGNLPESIMNSLIENNGRFDTTFPFNTTNNAQGSRVFEFVWTFEGNTGESSNQTGIITVNNMNRAPTIDPITDINTEPHVGETVEYDLRGTDPDDDDLIWDISSPDLGATIDQEGIFSWTPLDVHAGVQELTFTLTDSIALPVTTSVTFTVDQNNLPTFTRYDQTVSEGQPFLPLSSAVTNPEESSPDPVSIYRIKSGDLPESIINFLIANNGQSGTTFPFDTTNYAQGSRVFDFQWTFEDGTRESKNQNGTITVTNFNRPPTIQPPSNNFRVHDVDQHITFNLTGHDPDTDTGTGTGDPPPIWDVSDNSPIDTGAIIHQNGTFSWISDSRFDGEGPFRFTFTLTDVGNQQAETSVTVRITTDPIIAPDGSSTETEGNLVNTQFGETGPGPRTCTTGSILPESLTLTVTNRSTKCILTGTLSLDAITNGLTSQEFPIVYITNTTGIFASGTHTLTVKELPLFDPYEETVAEGGTLPSLYSTVIDPDLIPETISGYTVRDGNLPPYITALLNPVTGEFDGTIPFDAVTSAQGFVTFEFDWIFTDGIGSSGVQSGTITVTNTNRLPTINLPENIVRTVAELTPVTLPLTSTDDDTDADDPPPTSWDVTDNSVTSTNGDIDADGRFTWTPDDTHGDTTITFTFTLTDSAGGEALPETVSFDVTESNAEPTATSYLFRVDEGGSIDLPLTSSITDDIEDPPSDITYTTSDALPLGITLNSDGTFSGTVSHGATTNAISPQNFTFNWRYNDGDNDADETGTIEVTNDNRLPTINLPENIVRTVAELTPVTLPLTSTDDDTDADDPPPTSWDVTDNSVTSTNGDIDADGRFTWTPDDTHGDTTITFTFTLTDSAGGEALPETVSFDVTESNAEPTATSYLFRVDEGGSIDLPLTSSITDDIEDPPSDITYTTSDALPLGITLNSDGTFSGTVSHGATTNAISPQNFTFNWRYNDGDNDADETGTIEVTNDNRLPTINLPENIVRTVAELTPVTLPLTSTDDDTDADDPPPTSWDVTDNSVTSTNGDIDADGRFTWTPDDTHGDTTITFTFTLTDSAGGEALPETVSFDVTESNAEPTATSYLFRVDEGGSIDLPLTSSITDDIEDPPSDITYTTSDALPLGITLNSDGTFSGTVSHGATTNAISPQNFTFNWRYNDGDNDADETGTIEVTNDNRLPTINLPENIVRTVAELTPVTLPLTSTDDDTDADDPPPTSWDVTDNSVTSTNGDIDADGRFTWTPDDTHGDTTITFTFTLTDSAGGEALPETVSFDVTESNAEPTATSYLFRVDEGGSIDLPLTSSITDDIEDPPSDITYTTSDALPLGITLNSDGTFSGTVSHGATTNAISPQNFTFNWRYNDGDNDADETGTIEVTNDNRLPTINLPENIVRTVAELTPVTLPLTSTDDDTDADDPPPTSWDVTDNSVTSTNGDIDADGRFTWTPDDTHGDTTITFTFTLTDSAGGEALPETVSFDVTESNAEPTATSYLFRVDEGGSIDLPLTSSITDDIEDPPSDITYTTSDALPLGITLNSDGTFSGTVSHGATTNAISPQNFTFNWRYNDGDNDADETGTIEVTNDNRLPTINLPENIVRTVAELTPVTLPLTSTDDDTDADDPPPTSWDVTDNSVTSTNGDIDADGRFTWTPDDTHGDTTITFTFTLTDSAGGEALPETVSFDVTESNAEPTATSYLFRVDEGGSIDLPLTSSITDDIEDPPSDITYTTSDALPLGITLNSDGTFSGTVSHGATTNAISPQNFTFNWRYNDGDNDADETGTIEVTNDNRLPTINLPENIVRTVAELTPVTLPLTSTDDDTDADDPPPTSWDVTDNSVTSTNGDIDADGRFTWTPDDTHGDTTITFTFTLTDSAGGEALPETVSFDVTESNAEPTATSYLFRVDEGGSIDLPLTSSITDDIEDPPSDITYTTSDALPLGITLNSDGTFSGTVSHGATTNAISPQNFTFNWRYNDGDNDADETGTIEVTNDNRLPTINLPENIVRTVAELTPVTLPLTSTDDDTDADDPPPTSWDVTDNSVTSTNGDIDADGRFTWTPDDTHGDTTITFTFTLTDSAGGEALPETVSFDVTESNAEPTATSYLFRVDEGGSIDLPLTSSITDDIEDPPSDITYTTSDALPLGITLNSDGTFSGTVSHGATTNAISPQNFTFNWRYNDGDNDADETGTIEVTNDNRLPTINLPENIVRTVAELTPVTLPLTSTDDDTDADDPPPTSWDVTDNSVTSTNGDIDADGRFTWTPDDTHGDTTITFTFTLTDSAGGEALPETVSFDVTESNAEPTATSYLFRVDEGGSIDLPLTSSITDDIEDPPSDITYTTSDALPLGITLNSDGTFSGTVSHGATTNAISPQNFTFNWRYNDGDNDADETGTIEVTNDNRLPTINLPENIVRTVAELTPVTLPLTSTDDDTDADDPPPTSWDVTDNSVTSTNGDIDADGRFTWTPDDTHGDTTITFTFTLTDSAGGEALPETVSFDVTESNAEPTATSYLFRVDEGGSIDLPLTSSITDDIEDPPSDITYTTSDALPLGITLNSDGTFSGTVSHGATTNAISPQNFTFNWRYNDGDNDADETGTIEVTNDNRLPTINLPENIVRTVAELTPVTLPLTSTDDDTDADDPPPTSWDVTDNSVTSTNGDIDADGRFTWTPDDTHGDTTITFTFTLTDSAGGEALPETVSFDVTESNAEPTATSYLFRVDEGGSIDLPLTSSITDDIEDPPSDITYTTSDALPLGITLNSDGTFSGTVSHGATTNAISPQNFTFNWRYNDGDNDADETGTIEVTNDNRLPTINLPENIVRTVAELTPVTLPLTSTDDDTDADDPPPTSWDVTDNSVTSTNGDIDADGRFTWTPDDTHGDTTITFTFTLTDSAGGEALPETVSFDVTESNAEPTATSYLFRVDEGGSIDLPLTSSITDDIEDPPSDITYTTSDALPLGITLNSDGTFSGTVSHGATTNAISPQNFTFNWRYNDGDNDADETGTIEVTNDNRLPTINLPENIVRTVAELTPVTLPLTSTDDDTDADDPPPTSWDVTDNSVTSTNGDIDADGRFTWTPDDTHGDTTITFTFTLTDSAGGEALPETVSFDVTESNAEPTATSYLFRVDEGGSIDLPLTSSITDDIEDPPSDITYTTSDALPLGITLNSDGTFSGTVSHGATTNAISPQNFTFNWRYNDGDNDADETGTIEVTNDNRLPTINLPENIVRTVAELTPVTLPLTSTDDDTDADDPPPTSWDVTDNSVTSTNGDIDADGRFTWTPDDTHGDTTITFTFTLTDSAGGEALPETVSFDVTESNAEPTATSYLFRVDEGGSIDLPLTSSITDDIEDPPSDITYTTSDALPLGITLNSDGTFSGTVSHGATTNAISPQNFTFNWRYNDGDNDADETGTIEVTNDNRLPTINLPENIVRTVAELTPVTLPLTSTDDDTDADDPPPTSWDVTDNSVTSTNGDIDADGRFTWTPDDTHGDTTITFTFTLTDSAGGEALPETVSFDVTESNAEPTATSYLFRVDEGGSIDLPLTSSITDDMEDPPSDITYTTSDALPLGITLNSDGTFSGTVSHGATTNAISPQNFTFNWRYNDGDNDADETGTIEVTNDNRLPTINLPENIVRTVAELTPVTLPLTSTDDDTDADDPPPTSWDVTDNSVTSTNGDIDADGRFTWTPDDTHGDTTITFTFTLTDSAGGEALPETVSFDVTESNAEPTATSYLFRVDEGGSIDLPLTSSITDDIEDPPSDITYTTSDALPLGITLNSDGTFSGTVSHGATTNAISPQNFTFNWRYNDGDNDADETGTIEVTNDNRLPTINLPENIVRTVAELTPVTLPLTSTDDDTDADDPPPTSWDVTDNSVTSTNGDIDADGRFTWTPDDTHGDTTITFTFTLTDSAGGEALPETVSFDVTESNAEPTATSYLFRVDEGGSIDLPLTSSITDDIEDPPSDITYTTSDALPLGITLNSDGTFSGTVSHGATTNAISPQNFTFNWRYNDGDNDADETGTIEVTNSNVAPMIDSIPDFPLTLLINELVSISLRGTDPDGDVTMWSLSQPSLGAHITHGGDFTWTPREEHLGIQEFTFTLTDIHDEPAMALTHAFNVVEFNLDLSDSEFEFPSGQSTEHLLLFADTDSNAMIPEAANLDWEIRSVSQSGSIVDNPGIAFESGDVTDLNGVVLYTTNGFLTWNPLHDLIGESYQVLVRVSDRTSDTTQVGIVDVVVVDNIDPVITFTSLLTTSDSAGTTADFVEASDNNPNDDFVDEPTADDPNPEPRLTCVRDDDTPIANGDLLAIDSHTITCTAIDLSGNQAVLTQTVIVDYDADALSAIGSYAETVPEGSFIPPLSSVVTVPSRDLPASVSIYRIESDELPEDIISSLNNQTGAFSAEFSCSTVLAGEDPVTFSFTFTFEDDLVESDSEPGTITVSHNPRCGLGSGSSNDWKKKPTFGMSWEVSSDQLVDDGFTFNGYTLDITDNWHTDFTRTSSIIGEINSVTMKAYAADGFRYVVLSLGVPEIGMAPDAETDIILMLNRNYTNPDDYDIVEIIHEQKESLIDESRTTATVKRVLCNADSETVCHSFDMSFKVDAPLKSDVLAISAVDSKRRSTVTFINEGVEFTGQPILAPNTHSIVQKKTNQGPAEIITLTQQDRRYNIWEDDSGYLWFQNDHGSWFSITAPVTERFTDGAVHVMTRLHSNFGNLMQHEREKAALIFDASKLISVPDQSFSHDYSDVQYGVTKFEKLADELHIEQGKAQRIMELLR